MFLVEGNKTVAELHNSNYKIKEIFTTGAASKNLVNFNQNLITEVSERELKKISFLQNPKDSVALCEINPENFVENCTFNLVLDGLQDPGNLGTIIRLADWFGIQQIICSEDTADFYNPKVIQASMGSFTRVNIFYTNLSDFFKETKNINIGTDMDGENIYRAEFPSNLNLILGNEGNGIRPETEMFLQKKIAVPRFGEHRSTESLNVSMAAGIILGEIFSRK